MNILKLIKYKLRVFLEVEFQKPAFFTSDNFRDKKYHIGDYTYGCPEILFDDADANLTIGKFCSIADGVTIFLGGNHRTDWITTYPFNMLQAYFPEAEYNMGHPATKGNVVIENDVWIGRKVTIMSGINIGNGAVIGAESVVTKDIGAYEIWAGNPAKFIKKRFDDKTIERLLELQWWDKDLIWIKSNIKHLQSDEFNF